MLNFYQHLPAYIDPSVLHLGFFSLKWYALMYLVGLATVYFLLLFRIRKKEAGYDKNLIFDWLIYSFIGLFAGARLCYVLFYNFPYYLAHPLEAFLPISSAGSDFQVTGFFGMSYFGGLIGAVLAGYVFAKKRQLNFLGLADFIIPAIPAGYFFGRLGNFLNGELYGRVTDKFWGMYFFDGLPGQGTLRHPSQLYEAFLEGLVIFVFLWLFRRQGKFSGQILALYLLLYGFFRFFIEFFREPDSQIGLFFAFLSLGQLFSLVMMLAAILLYFFRQKRYNGDN